MATQSSILAWRTPWTEEPGGPQSTGSQRAWWATVHGVSKSRTRLSDFTSLHFTSTLHMRWPKYWSFSFSIIPSKEHPGLISFRMDWLDFLAVQGTLRSLLQHHSSKASILRHSAFFTVQLSHPYMTTGKTIALTRQTLAGKVMSLLITNKALQLHQLPAVRKHW